MRRGLGKRAKLRVGVGGPGGTALERGVLGRASGVGRAGSAALIEPPVAHQPARGADQAIRRHWHLVFCAFSFCWRAWFTTGPPDDRLPPGTAGPAAHADSDANSAPERGENGARPPDPTAPGLLAEDAPARPRVARSVVVPLALLARLVERAPAS